MHFRKGHSSTDQYLVKQVLTGDQEAFAQIVRQTEALVAQIVFKMVAVPADRQDIVQDVYLKAFRNLPGFNFNAKLSTWLGKIAYNTCLHYLEKKKLVFLPDDNEQQEGITNRLDQLSQQQGLLHNDVENELSAKQLASILGTAIKTLSPPIYQTLITLYHQEELSYAEIGEITSLPEGTVKNYLFRARKALKEDLLSRYKKEEL
ncbi:RNA polymerase subunit sigma-24 [Niastella koreensis]|uniref:RNA polymerase, sigma-24 subunit, ECF subfamily n=2 Tax=Niastella koreensis TaxID=354356 RepID=G8TKK7_NIAKG|nr:sigma-70 family RNA polymerase sigma factor [Niastella koreensis]AEV98681.1 RNA polymerase, sigma-24 subunit, ECF subfamily [Niastella koreensis GR20-10]OQP44924.1 RNA polymerase subunit sigma-24 [Niastella koreensis]